MINPTKVSAMMSLLKNKCKFFFAKGGPFIFCDSGSCVDLGLQRIRKAVEDSSSRKREACLKARETLKASKRGKVIENGHEGQKKTSTSEVVLRVVLEILL